MTDPPYDDPSTWPCHKLSDTEDQFPADIISVCYANSYMWLHQAAAGQIPSGGFTKEDAK